MLLLFWPIQTTGLTGKVGTEDDFGVENTDYGRKHIGEGGGDDLISSYNGLVDAKDQYFIIPCLSLKCI